MTDVQSLARVITAGKLLADAARAEGEQARAELAEHMRQTGTERVRVTDDDGWDLGAVSLSRGRPSARVVDEIAFAAWVAQRYPSEIVQSVRPAFAKRLLDEAAKLGDPVDPQTGEVMPGVEVGQGEPHLTVRPSAEAKTRMAALLAEARGLLALGGGDAASA